MVATILRTTRALQDLVDIHHLIASDRPNAADKVIERLDRRIRMLAFQPRSGAARPDIRDGLRLAVVAPYLILYELTPDDADAETLTVLIVRVVDSRRDLNEAI